MTIRCRNSLWIKFNRSAFTRSGCFLRGRRWPRVATCTSRWRATLPRWQKRATSCASVSTCSTKADFRSAFACATPLSRRSPGLPSSRSRDPRETASSAPRRRYRPSVPSTSPFQMTSMSTPRPTSKPDLNSQRCRRHRRTVSTEVVAVSCTFQPQFNRISTGVLTKKKENFFVTNNNCVKQ